MSITNGKNVDQLLDLQREVQEALSNARADRVAAWRATTEELASDVGMSFDAFCKQNSPGNSKSARNADKPRRGVVQPKYEDPNDQNRTWSGKGPAPAWFTAAMKQGYSKQDMEIGGRGRSVSVDTANGHARA